MDHRVPPARRGVADGCWDLDTKRPAHHKVRGDNMVVVRAARTAQQPLGTWSFGWMG